MGRVLAAFLVLAMLVLAGCTENESPSAERQEKNRSASEQTREQASSSTAQTPTSRSVDDTVGVGPFLVTLNDAEARLSNDDDQEHHYAMADLTLENRTQDTLEATDAEYLLRDEEGYSFDTGTLSEQRPPPEGQVVPGGKASGEVAFDLGEDPVEDPLTLSVSFSGQQEELPALFEFGLQPVEERAKSEPKVAANDEPEPMEGSAEQTEPAYELISDPSGNLTVEVPPDWEAETGPVSEGRGGPGSWTYYAGEQITASITTAQSLDAWKGMGDGPTPGTYVVASRSLAENFTDEELIYSKLFANKAGKCAEGSYEEVGRVPYTLKIQEWEECGPNDTTSLVVAAAPSSRECVVVMDVIVPSEADREAADHILDSFEVDCGALPPPVPEDTSASASQSADADAREISCGGFRTMFGDPSQWQAQQYYDFEATREEKAILDPDGDGFACADSESYTDSPEETVEEFTTPSSPEPDSNTPDPSAPNPNTPDPDVPSSPPPSSSSGPENCDEVNGPIPTPPGDPNNLDGDEDGTACE